MTCVFPAPLDGDAQVLESRGDCPPPPHTHTHHPANMESKKPSSGMLWHLRQKMVPRFRRGKASKLPVEIDPSMDHRMSSSVPDMRDVKHAFAHSSSRTRPLQSGFPSYSSPSSPLVKPPGGAAEGGSGLKSTLTGRVTGRSEHRLSAPLDYTDWGSSHELFHGVCEDQKSSPGAHRRTTASMEPEEQVQPEKVATNPDPPPQETSQDTSQVQAPKESRCDEGSQLQQLLYALIFTIPLKE